MDILHVYNVLSLFRINSKGNMLVVHTCIIYVQV